MSPARPFRELERALALAFVAHGLAMLAMALLLLPSLPGGGAPSDAARVASIALHPWRFRIGWWPWHFSAASDLVLAIALLRTRAVPRTGAALVALLTVVAVACDQSGQLLWVTRGVALARQAHASGELANYLQFERRIFPLTGYWAALLYTITALGWTWCFARAGTWSRGLTRLSAVLWTTFLLASLGPLLPPPLRLAPALVAVGNGAGFALMQLWFAWVLERVMRRERPDAPHGRWAPWRYPWPGVLARVFDAAANSRLVRAVCERLPLLEFRSDMTDVVYVNYVAPADVLARLVPEGLELQRLGPDKRYAVFTFLTYRHGHFGPGLLGPLRVLFPSPVQSNWRVYVRDARTGRAGIYFVTNAVGTRLHAIGARVMAEGMPMHLLAAGSVVRDAVDGALRVELDPGPRGSAPDASLRLAPAPARALPDAGAWRACFDDYDAMLRHVVPQDRALSTQPWRARTTRQEISLGIALATCEPLAGGVRSRAAEAMVGAGPAGVPLCFRVPGVRFRFGAQVHDAW